ncbi:MULTISPECIES: hypothetical protein [unclassified Marinobacter]|jgi:hypothetical protein|uniref:hypothetical protein n=1 Tax=unclassified Marinobacter TaxID=83889 RepID=UPI0019254057|nr:MULTISPECIES: hypothetical protein [unclassified Marinobacter]MBL3823266.1 hypothetical protein [Marinobacter sp. MC3]MBL3892403.1 hypothetical protein [Marinobacter sp. MW3]
MNPDLLALALMNDPNYTLLSIDDEWADRSEEDETRASFEMVADGGELIGYIKTWHDDDDYAGFVHFDAEGNIVDWKTFAKEMHQNGTKS